VIGYDPDAAQHIITIDRGARDLVRRDDGVVTGAGAVGRIIEVGPVTSKVLLINDAASKLPALVQHGRWWANAVGTQTRLKLQYVSQDAKLRVGDAVVTGEGRSFHAGTLIGHISQISSANAGALDQSATVEPAVTFGSLSRVLVLTK
jgi:rod shape-determining protein MreC